jgi:hypothetical protein
VKSIIPAVLLYFACALAYGQQPAAPDSAQTPPASAPAAPAAAPDTSLQNIDSGWSIRGYYWLSQGQPVVRLGTPPIDPYTGLPMVITPGSEDIDLPPDKKRTPGVVVSFPAGKFNRLEISFFQASGTGLNTIPQDLNLFGISFTGGDTLDLYYRLRNFKVTWNYLTWPSPPTAKFRLKTLWEVQYLNIDSSYLDLNTLTSSFGSKTIILPTLGAGIQYVPSKHFYLDVRGTGMGFPGHSVIWDASAEANFRLGHLEIFGGAKAYHFRSSPGNEQYFSGTLKGPYGGLGWRF